MVEPGLHFNRKGLAAQLMNFAYLAMLAAERSHILFQLYSLLINWHTNN